MNYTWNRRMLYTDGRNRVYQYSNDAWRTDCGSVISDDMMEWMLQDGLVEESALAPITLHTRWTENDGFSQSLGFDFLTQPSTMMRDLFPDQTGWSEFEVVITIREITR